MNFLILNGDGTNNRGDRAILMGNILLLKKTFPDANIYAFSYNPNRDREWYGINFFSRNSLREKLKAIKNADIIFWGGGELIQDDTSKVKIPYWCVNILLLSLVFRKKIIGLGQGLGPVNSRLNRILARITLNRLEIFISRDNYSEAMMRMMGVEVRIINSFDPAILVASLVKRNRIELFNYLKTKGFRVDEDDKIIGVGVRRWFHQQSSWIPHKYAVKYNLRKIPGDKEFTEMKKNLAILLDELVERLGYKVVFFPMYTPTHEADDKVSSQIIDLMRHGNYATVFTDDVSPQRQIELIAGTDIFFGIRLHSTILSTSTGVPSLTFYYVPKGKSYFEQLGIPENSFPVENLLTEEGTLKTLKQFHRVAEELSEYRLKIENRINKMREAIFKDAEDLKNYL